MVYLQVYKGIWRQSQASLALGEKILTLGPAGVMIQRFLRAMKEKPLPARLQAGEPSGEDFSLIFCSARGRGVEDSRVRG
jgi:hypothetical protein